GWALRPALAHCRQNKPSGQTNSRRRASGSSRFPMTLAFLTHDPKTEVEVLVVFWKMGAQRHARQPGSVVMEGPTAHSPPAIAALGPLGIGHRTLRVIFSVVPILHPFGHVAAHIVEAPSVGLSIRDRLRLLDIVPSPIVRRRIPAERVRHCRARKLVRCASSR